MARDASRILLVDDEPQVLFTLTEVLSEHEHVTAASAEEALTRLEGVDLVITDLSMPGMDGLELLSRIRAIDPAIPVILLTARGSERVAVRAMKEGAHDYLTKPFDVDELTLVVERALEQRSHRRSDRRLAAERAIGRPFVGRSRPIERLLDAIERVAPRDVPVLVQGETGTGKELVASLLHARSRRAAGPIVRFNCAAIPAELADAELFGHVRGAFTGAVAARRGFVAEAHGGTLVLDEIGELPLALQPKLLRALQEGEIQPVGAGRVERVDVRFVACTHRDLAREVAEGRFREDLFYRINVVTLEVPPLRARPSDIPLLAEALAARVARRFGMDDVRLSPALLDALAARPWPGNVRELESTLTRMIAMSEGGLLDVGALDARASAPVPRGAPATFRAQVEAFERDVLSRALAEAGGNQSEAARRLGMSRVTMIDRLKRYGLS